MPRNTRANVHALFRQLNQLTSRFVTRLLACLLQDNSKLIRKSVKVRLFFFPFYGFQADLLEQSICFITTQERIFFFLLICCVLVTACATCADSILVILIIGGKFMHEAICSRIAASRRTQSASHRYSNKRGTQIFNFPRKREGRMDQEKNFFDLPSPNQTKRFCFPLKF